MGGRFSVAYTAVATDWMLRLEADCRVEPALREELAALSPAPQTAWSPPIVSPASRSEPRSIPRCPSGSAAARQASSPTATPRTANRPPGHAARQPAAARPQDPRTLAALASARPDAGPRARSATPLSWATGAP